MTEAKDDTIIKFPKSKKSTPKSVEQERIDKIDTNLAEIEQAKIEEMVSYTIMAMLEVMEDGGFELSDDPAYVKSMALSMEAIRAQVYKYYGKEHPLHELAEKTITVDENGMAMFGKTPIMVIQKLEAE